MKSLAQTPGYSSPFDTIAEQYDATFTSSTIGRVQRDPVWDELKRSFRPGDRILDIGCGTGVDARFLAEHGIEVVACDNSVSMLRVAERRIAELPQPPGSVQLRLLPAEEISSLSGDARFDGALSNFGAVNCVEDMAKLASDLTLLLKPGANLLLCLMGPLCLWETVWYLLQGEFAKAFRRFHGGGEAWRWGGRSGPLSVPAFHPACVRSRLLSQDNPRHRSCGASQLSRGLGPPISGYCEAWGER